MTQVQIDVEALCIIMEYAYLGEHRQGGDCRHELVVGCPLCDSFRAGLAALGKVGGPLPQLDWWADPALAEENPTQFMAALAHGEPVEVVDEEPPTDQLNELLKRAELMNQGHCPSRDGHSCPDVG